jgi:hypothetical protein
MIWTEQNYPKSSDRRDRTKAREGDTGRGRTQERKSQDTNSNLKSWRTRGGKGLHSHKSKGLQDTVYIDGVASSSVDLYSKGLEKEGSPKNEMLER